ncbi:MAG: flippase-like domain-containing protein [Firmicutes bacterium]|nr:flippase-like domain-containing protein [Bacillota bacterium]
MEIIKSIKKNTIILLFITMLVLYLVLKDDFNKVVKTLSSMDYRYILLAILFFTLSIIIKAYVNYKTINNPNKVSLIEAIKHNVIVQFFNGITPFSTGGQPMEIYMLTEHDIKASKAATITIQGFIFYQIALVIFGLIAVTYNAIFGIFPKSSILRELTLLGFFVNTMVVVALFIITFSRRLTKKISKFIINLLVKIKIVKNKEETVEKWNEKLEEFHNSAKELRKRKKLFVGGVVLNMLSLACLYIIPLFIVYSLKDYSSMNAADSLVASAYVLIIGAFVPIPGASGGIEFGFLNFFNNFLNKNVISGVLIVWRFITYYLGMIIGALAFSLEKKGD